MFGRMHIYTVHVMPGETLAENKAVFVKEGFNIWAFLLTGFWALYERLWIPLAGIVAFNIVLGILMNQRLLGELGFAALQLGFNLIVGYHANDWLRAKLTQGGHILADISASDSKLRAEQRYFERALAA